MRHASRLLPTLISKAGSSDAIPLTNGLQKRDFTFVGDVADSLIQLGCVKTELGQVVNLASGTLQSVRHFIEVTAEVSAIERQRLKFGEIPTRQEEMVHDPVNNERLRALTGSAPSSSIQEGIRQTLATPWPHEIV